MNVFVPYRIELGRVPGAIYNPHFDISFVSQASQEQAKLVKPIGEGKAKYTDTDIRYFFEIPSIMENGKIVGYSPRYSGKGVNIALIDTDGYYNVPGVTYVYHIGVTRLLLRTMHDNRSVATLKDNSFPFIGVAPESNVFVFPTTDSIYTSVPDFAYAFNALDEFSKHNRIDIVSVPMEAHGLTSVEKEAFRRIFAWFAGNGIPIIIAYGNQGMSELVGIGGSYAVKIAQWDAPCEDNNYLYAPSDFGTTQGVFTGTSASTVAYSGFLAVLKQNGYDIVSFAQKGGCQIYPDLLSS